MSDAWLPLLPHILLLFGGACIIGGARFLRKPAVWGFVSLAVLAAAAGCVFHLSHSASTNTVADAWGRFGTAVAVAFLVGGAVLVLGAWKPHDDDRYPGESHGLLLCGIAVAMLTGFTDDAIALFLSLELCGLVSVGLLMTQQRGHVFTGLTRRALILHGVSTALFLLALSVLCGYLGTTSLNEMQHALAAAVQAGEESGLTGSSPRIGRTAFVLLFAAVAVKSFLVPFHFGAPEVLTESSTLTCSYSLCVARAAALVVLFRLGFLTLVGFESTGLVISAVLSGGTMLVGTALAIGRERLREKLTYLLIGQGGTVLFGLSIAWGRASAAESVPPVPSFLTRGETAAAMTLLAVSLSVAGIFSLLNTLQREDRPVDFVEELTGLLRERPLVAVAFAVCLLNLIGVPPLPGFWARLMTLTSALAVTKQSADGVPLPHPAFLILVVVMGIQSLMTVAVLFRVFSEMIFEPPVSRSHAVGSRPALISGVVCALIILGIGFSPSQTIDTLNEVIPQSPGLRDHRSPSAGASRSVNNATTKRNDLAAGIDDENADPVKAGVRE